MEQETDIAVIKDQLRAIKTDTQEIKTCLYGNGRKGIKERVDVLEVKLWILLILLIPLAGWGMKLLLWK